MAGDKKPDKEAARMANELREVKVTEKLEKSNWRTYEVEWAGMTGQGYVNNDKLIEK